MGQDNDLAGASVLCHSMKSVLFSTNVGLSFLFFRGKWCCIYSVFLSQLVTSSHLSAAPSCLVRPGEWQGPHHHGNRGSWYQRVLHPTVQARHREGIRKVPSLFLPRKTASLPAQRLTMSTSSIWERARMRLCRPQPPQPSLYTASLSTAWEGCKCLEVRQEEEEEVTMVAKLVVYDNINERRKGLTSSVHSLNY